MEIYLVDHFVVGGFRCARSRTKEKFIVKPVKMCFHAARILRFSSEDATGGLGE